MIWIRVFLWTLIGLMTLQGFLHADEYGGEASFLGGVGITMAIWGERFQGILTRTVKLPRAFVLAALQETARHPQVYGGAALREFQHSMAAFQERELAWVLGHVVLLENPEGVQRWATLEHEVGTTYRALAAAKAATCRFPLLYPRPCATAVTLVRTLESNLTHIRRAQDAWGSVLNSDPPTDVGAWWATVNGSAQFVELLSTYRIAIANLYNVTDPTDRRIRDLLRLLQGIDGPWTHSVLRSLAEGSMWKSCIEFVRRREERLREHMMASGLQALFHTQDRVLNATLRLNPGPSSSQIIHSWFSELVGHNWWPSDAMPPIVRRCLHQETGDCTRIGATEIAALTAQIGEKQRIAEDWARRLFIGMWNALPAVGVLFAMECVVLCLRKPRTKLRRHYVRTLTAERYDRRGPGGPATAGQEEVPQRLDAGDRGPDGHVGGPRHLLPMDA